MFMRLRVVRVVLASLVLVSCSLGGSLAEVIEADERTPTLAAESLQRGQRGYGFSVFSGHELERFEFEVLGLVRNSSPGQDYLMVRLSGQGLEHSGIIAGMSGSPIYIDGKLVGAVAYAWPFAKDPIAGVTPIASMRAIGDGVSGGSAKVSQASVMTVLDLLQPGDATVQLKSALDLLKQPSSSRSVPAIGWGIAGFPTETEAWLTQSLGSLAPIGEAQSSAGELVPGSAVAAVLVGGDLRLAATGTVTDRYGDTVLAFGHPFYSLGSISVPMAESEIITVMPSQANSFKIASLGRTIGAFHEDRQPGVKGTVGVRADTTPLRIEVRTPEPVEFNMELAQIPLMTPALAAISAIGAQTSASRSTGPMGVDLEASFDLGEFGTLTLEQSFDGANASVESAIFVLSYLNFFMQNSFSAVEVDAIDLTISQFEEPRTAIMTSGYAERTEVRPGDTVGINLEFVPFRGEPFRHRVEIELPADLPSGRYSLIVGDGVTIDLHRQQIEPSSPIRFDQALRIVRGFHSRRDLVVLGLHSGRGLAVAGEVLPRLPGRCNPSGRQPPPRVPRL